MPLSGFILSLILFHPQNSTEPQSIRIHTGPLHEPLPDFLRHLPTSRKDLATSARSRASPSASLSILSTSLFLIY